MEPSPPAGKHHLKMTQKHFLQDDTQTPDPKYPSPFDYRWDIPISYVSSENPNFDVDQTSVQWFTKDQASKTIEVNNDLAWMIVNPKQYGFYRVNYPSEYWQKIIDQQAADHTKIDELNRAQIIDDAFDLALAGKLSITYAMELTKYLLKEESWFAWDAAITSLSYVSSALKRTEAYGDFKTYYKTLITPFYDKFNNGWAVDLTSSIVEQYRQRDAVSRACSYNVGDCRAKAKELVTTWMSNPDNNPISPNLRDTAYCYAVKQGDEAVWDFIFEKFQNENVAGEQIKLLRSLGCTDEMWLLQRLLDYAIDDTKVRKQDSYIAVGAVAGNTLGKFLAWDWLRGNWEQLYSEFSVGIMMLGRFVTSSLDKRFTQFDYDQIVAFTDQTEELGSATRAFAQKKEGTQANIKYLERNLDDLVRWLSSQP